MCRTVIIRLNSVQLQLQLPTGTELGKKFLPLAHALRSDQQKSLSRRMRRTTQHASVPLKPTALDQAESVGLLAGGSFNAYKAYLSLELIQFFISDNFLCKRDAHNHIIKELKP